jgi:WD40 repeat protein
LTVAESNVPDDTCIVELQLPPGATVSVDGKDYGSPPRLSFDSLERQKVFLSQFVVHFKEGGEETRTVLIRGGWRAHLALAWPSKARPELALQTGHSTPIISVGFSSDGRHVLTGSYDQTAILWDVPSGQQLRTFKGHSLVVTSVAFSPDGQQVLTGSWDKTAILWDAASGRQLRTFQGHTAEITSVAFGPDGTQVLTGSKDRTAILWDASSGQQLHTFKGHNAPVSSVTFSPDGRQAITGSGDKTAILWDTASGQKLRTFKGYAALSSVAFGSDGRNVLTGSIDKTVILWDAFSGQELRTFLGHSSIVMSVAFSPDGRQVLTGSQDGTAILWDAASGRQLRTFKGHSSWVNSVAFNPDGRQVLTGSQDGTAILWDAASGQQLRTFKGRASWVTSVAFSSGGRQMLTGAWDKTAILWDASSGQQLRTFQGHTKEVISVAFSPDGQHVLTGGNDRTALLWDAASGQQVRTFNGHKNGVCSVAFNPDGRQVLTGSFDKTAVLWDASTGQQLRTFKGHAAPVNSVAFAPDGRQVLTGAEDGTAILWNVANGQQLRTLKGHNAPVFSVAFSLVDRQVLTGSYDQTAILWDAPIGQQLRSLKGHSAPVFSVAFSPDGRQVLTGSWDKTAILWDAASGRQLRTFKGHTSWVCSVAFSPDGTQVLTGAIDGTTRLWDIATGQELAWLISLDAGKDWLVVTPEGLFDGSAGGRQKVSFRVGGGLNVVPVDRFFQDFCRPGLLAAIWRGERPMPEVKLGNQVPPLIRIVTPKSGVTTSESQVTIEAEVIDQGSGIKGPWLMQNGSRVLVTGSSVRRDRTLARQFIVNLVSGDNRLEVHASSSDGSWDSEPAMLVIHYETPLVKPDMYVLAVGINKYADAKLNLNYAAKDAQAIGELFQRRGKTLYDHVHSSFLVDQAATRSAIKENLKQITSQTRPEDTLVVFLAGHGTMIGQRYYFVPYELHKQSDYLEEDIRKQGLPHDELSDYLGTAKALKRILILDTCASGGALAKATKGRSPFELRGVVERLSRSYGLFTIAASAATEEAQESKELGHGVLSYCLLAGLKAVDTGPLADKYVQPNSPDRVIDVSEWFTFAQGQMPRLSEKLSGSAQDPEVSNQGRSFPLLPIEDP